MYNSTKFALISVSDKSNIESFASELIKLNYDIIATGKTAHLLNSSGIKCFEVSDITKFPEIFDGRVKTLHPKIFGGILFRRNNEKDLNEKVENDILEIDIVCVNLYPFEKVAENKNSSLDELIENIDIGGPSLIRAAAKNYKFVSVLTNPEQYESFLKELKSGKISDDTKKKLAVEAFNYTSLYDTIIVNKLEEKFDKNCERIRINLPLEKKLRYGENPHQSASIYGNFAEYFDVLHGKELSHNNILDLIAGVDLIEELAENSCAIIKHNNPAGVASYENNYDSYLKALSCDPVSAFGGIVIFNSTVEEKLASKLNEIFLEIIVAPDFTEEALVILRKKRDRRLVKQIKKISDRKVSFRSIPGGIIQQDLDLISDDFSNLKIVTEKKPTEKEIEELKFAWVVSKHVKSNAIVFTKNKMTVGIGAGQVSRIDSVKIAGMKANEFNFDLSDAVAASDAFFPFADGVLEIAKYRIKAIIQPGGSVRDNEAIEAANKNNISMIFTGKRHFKH